MDPNKAAAEARRRKADDPLPIREHLRRAYRTFGDPPDAREWADVTAWWRDPDVLVRLGPSLADLFADTRPTVVLGPQSRGMLVGALVAVHLGVGLIEIRKRTGSGRR